VLSLIDCALSITTRMENDEPVECEDRAESDSVNAKDHASIALLEREVMLCTEARLKLNTVLMNKTSNKQCTSRSASKTISCSIVN